MRTQEVELLMRATELRDAPAGRWAALIDMDHIPHVDDRFFFRVLKNRVLESLNRDRVEVFLLSHHRLCVIGSRHDIGVVQQKMAHLSNLLLEHSKAAIECQVFDPSSRPEEFAERCRKLVEEVREENPEEEDASFSDEDENLARYLTIEETLHSADLSSLVREHPIYDFEDPGQPRIIAYELSSDIENLEDMFGTSIRQNPWLFDRVTEILDKRMLFHLMRDRASTERMISINIHMANVLSDEFKAFAQRSSFGWQHHFIFEIPFIEMNDDPDRYRHVVERFRTYHAMGAVDGVPWSSLKELHNSADTIQFIKVPWSEALRGLSDAQSELMKEDIERLGTSRCVLYHCDDSEAAAVGLDLGFRFLQGQGVDADVAERHRQLVDRKVAEVRALSEIERHDREEEEPRSGFVAWLRRLLGGGRRRRDEDDEDY